MLALSVLASLAGLLIQDVSSITLPSNLEKRQNITASTIAPKIMIISMFDPEADVWYGIPEFDVLAQNISLPGLSPLFPEVHCTADGEVCQITIGEGGKWLGHLRVYGMLLTVVQQKSTQQPACNL